MIIVIAVMAFFYLINAVGLNIFSKEMYFFCYWLPFFVVPVSAVLNKIIDKKYYKVKGSGDKEYIYQGQSRVVPIVRDILYGIAMTFFFIGASYQFILIFTSRGA